LPQKWLAKRAPLRQHLSRMEGMGLWIGCGALALSVACGSSRHAPGGAGGADAGGSQAGNGGGGAGGGSASQGGSGCSTEGGSGNTSGGAGDAPAGGATSGSGGGPSSDGGVGGSPDEVEPDLTGLVPTSKHWLLYAERGGLQITNHLVVLDLDSKQEHLANPTKTDVTYTNWSADQRTFVFHSSSAAAVDNIVVVRFAQGGFVPAKPLDGYTEERGNFAFERWDETSRYLVAARGGPKEGIEVADVVAGKRLGTIEVEPNLSGLFAPHGSFFAFKGERGNQIVAGYASVGPAGLNEPVFLPAGSSMPAFSGDGKYAYYSYGVAPSFELKVLKLADGTEQNVQVAGPGETFWYDARASDASSLLVWVKDASSKSLLVRAFFDGSSRTVLSDPARSADGVRASDDANLLAIHYADSLELVQVSPPAKQVIPLATLDYSKSAMVGRSLVHDASGTLSVAQLDAQGALQHAPIGKAGEAAVLCVEEWRHVPTDKLAYLTNSATELVLVNLALDPPAEVARLTASQGRTFDCPLWRRSGTALAVQEADATTSRIQVLSWTDREPSAPVVALDSLEPVALYAFDY
jgi:hypothetical protein